MKTCTKLIILAVVAAARSIVQAQAHGAPHARQAQHDSAFVEMQRRGEEAMGANQYTSAHKFETRANGGRIVLVAAPVDTAAVARIQAHFRAVAAAFARGDFAVPGFVHAGEVPGTRVMAARRKAIRYLISDLPHGAEMLITTKDLKALHAIREFLAFQRREHHAAGGQTERENRS